MGKKITDHVEWVGKTDWELKHFHGDEYSVDRGSSYNSYLIRDGKNILIDTVWSPYDREFVRNLEKVIDLKNIDAIIMNHNENDHSGALPELMSKIPNTPIYCTKKGETILRGLYHQDWNFITVKTGDTLDLGNSTLTFVEAPMLHWPDTMFTYYDTDQILFSNDAFGQHFASENLYNEDVDKAQLMEQAEKYYANILNLYSTQVKAKINQVLKMNLPLKLICPSHGVIWKEDPTYIVEKYLEWANDYQTNQITIVYDTMWNSTRQMAQAIARGIEQADSEVEVRLMNASKEDKNDIITQIFQSKAILMGSPTINYGYSYATAGLLEMIKGLRFKKKKAAAFGSYGWSGDAVKQISAKLEECGFEISHDPLGLLWNPDAKQEEACVTFGKEFATSLK